MRALIDIGHPAHVHFFHHPIRILRERGHEVVITSRDKEIAVALLDELGLAHQCLSTMATAGLLGLGVELIARNYRLWEVVRRFRPNVMGAIGGVNIAQVGSLARVPSLVFYDTENARLQNAITYPFASCVIVPRCYETWVPKNRHIRYNGYHELSYLHPNRFKPDRNIAVANGLAAVGDTFFIRLVSWRASHDVGERGWSPELLRSVVRRLSAQGKVLISSEARLPADLIQYSYQGKVTQVHHILAHCRGCIGESATMASECAVLGAPAIYAAHTGRGYTNEQERRYGLVQNVRDLNVPAIERALDEMLSKPRYAWQEARAALLADTIDVAAFAADCLETYPAPLRAYRGIAP